MELSQRLDLGALNLEEEKPFDRSIETRLSQLVSRITGAEPEPGKTLAELGVDSLDRIEFAIRAEEEFGVRIDDSVYTDSLTLDELAGKLAEKGTTADDSAKDEPDE